MRNSLLLLLILLLSSFTCQGDVLVLDPDDGAYGGTFYGEGGVRTSGYQFAVGSSPLWVLALGVRDWDGGGLSNAHEVGLWDSDMNLLTHVVVSSGVSTSGFRYADVNLPMLLSPGQSYIVGAAYVNKDADRMGLSLTLDGALPLYHPAVTFETIRFGDSTTGLTFPDIRGYPAEVGLFGPNLEFQVVPEPSAVVLLMGGAAIIFSFRKRRNVSDTPGTVLTEQLRRLRRCERDML